jgi:hypothetical protein
MHTPRESSTGVERREIHVFDSVDNEPRKVASRQPLADVGRHQKHLLALTRDEVLAHVAILLTNAEVSLHAGKSIAMQTLLGWLPLVGLLAVGVALGIAARRLRRRARRAIYLAPLIVAALTTILMWRSPPCPDLLDGPCQHNWVSETAAIGFYIALPLTVLAAATLAVTRASRRARST